MVTHRIITRDGAYRIEANAPNGKTWLLSRRYPTEKTALVRLNAMRAMVAAELPRFDAEAHQPQA